MKYLYFLFLISCFGSADLKAQSKQIKHVVLIGFDGLGAYAFDSADIPHIRQLMKDGSYSLKARSVLPSSSAVNWASMIMGAGPTMHGYTEWGSKTPEIPSITTNKYNLFPSIFSLVRDQRPQAKTGVVYSWEGIGYLFEKKAVDLDVYTANDSLSLQTTIHFLKTEKPVLTFVHFDQPDGVGHNIGHRTPAYYEMVHKVDTYVGALREAIREAGMEKSTVIILSSDHGGTGKGHGGKTLDEVEIPWIIAGPGIKKNNEIKEVIITYDTAPTIAYALRLKTPQAWRGKRVLAAFKK